MTHKVPFLVAALGRDADPFMLHLYAVLAEQERRMISQRTRDALQAAKGRGGAQHADGSGYRCGRLMLLLRHSGG
jgi:DNA invertase Pin-like site-specific DNA recombinase